MSGEITGDARTLPNISGDANDKTAKELREKLHGQLRGQLRASLRTELAEFALKGDWGRVSMMYEDCPEAHTARIDEDSKNTALHVAIELNEEDAAKALVNAILKHEEHVRGLAEEIREHEKGQGPPIKEEQWALEMTNESGDTPLHVAASRGFAKLCKLIIGDEDNRLDLLRLRNKEGETPVFLAALNWNQEAFAYLFGFYKFSRTLDDGDLIRQDKDGVRDTILHCAIRREYFDLAVIITYYFGTLRTYPNKDGLTPLQVLATRPSAFSSTKLSWWKSILYYCIVVEQPNVDRTMKNILTKIEQPRPEELKKECRHMFSFWPGKLLGWRKDDEHDEENASKSLEIYEAGFLPPNYATVQNFVWPAYATVKKFVRSAYVHSLGCLEASKKVAETKKKHLWSDQLLKALMNRPYRAVTGGRPDPNDLNFDIDDVFDVYHQERQGSGWEQPQEETSAPGAGSRKGTPTQNNSKEGNESNTMVLNCNCRYVAINAIAKNCEKVQSMRPQFLIQCSCGKMDCNNNIAAALAIVDNNLEPFGNANNIIDKKETAFLIAARNGIVEMVNMILDFIPSAIHNTNSKKQNVLLVAVKDRQPQVVQALKNKSKEEVWNNLILGVDDHENTALHLAAEAVGRENPRQIAGSALQMMWDIKWYQYIKSIVPEHCYFRSNKDSKTAGQIFEKSHEKLVEKGSEWLKDTSQSCSVVAALVAGVSFATASSVPGGTNDEGKPPLEGQPAFDAFAISSLIGLCFSVTGLIMFLSILTSRKEARDFHRGLPLKLLVGLSSLFVSIIAMFVSFCSGHFFIINHKYKTFLFPFYAATSIPVAFYALAQFPLYFDLLAAIITKVPLASDIGDTL